MIKATTIQILENDIRIIQTLNFDNEKRQIINEKINALLLYKRAEVLLTEKYDKNNIDKAKQSLQPIIQKEPVKLLIALFDEYWSHTINLKNTLKEIQKKNEMKAGSIEDLISDKKNSTLRMIENFVYDNEVDLTKYIYLNQILIELKNRKMKNVDADVQDLLGKL